MYMMAEVSQYVAVASFVEAWIEIFSTVVTFLCPSSPPLWRRGLKCISNSNGTAIVKGVHSNSMQGDLKFIDVLKQMGCAVTEEREGICVSGPKDGEYCGVDVDMNDFSDQSMTLAAIAPFAKTTTVIKNIEHIRLQESDRIEAMVNELNNLGVDVKEGRDRIEISPANVKPGVVDTYNDHRMAMSFALIGLRVDGIIIDNYECCCKTFENYFEVLEKACAQ